MRRNTFDRSFGASHSRRMALHGRRSSRLLGNVSRARTHHSAARSFRGAEIAPTPGNWSTASIIRPTPTSWRSIFSNSGRSMAGTLVWQVGFVSAPFRSYLGGVDRYVAGKQMTAGNARHHQSLPRAISRSGTEPLHYSWIRFRSSAAPKKVTIAPTQEENQIASVKAESPRDTDSPAGKPGKNG